MPLDVRAVELRAGRPTIACPRCTTPVPVPTFDVHDVFEHIAEVETDDEPGAVANEPRSAAPVLQHAEPGPSRISIAKQVVREERRQQRGGELAACRSCGTGIRLDPETMRLRSTHASLSCPSCGTEVRVRREDAFRNTDWGFVWTFTCYSGDDGPPAAPSPPTGPRRIFRRKR